MSETVHFVLTVSSSFDLVVSEHTDPLYIRDPHDFHCLFFLDCLRPRSGNKTEKEKDKRMNNNKRPELKLSLSVLFSFRFNIPFLYSIFLSISILPLVFPLLTRHLVTWYTLGLYKDYLFWQPWSWYVHQ